MTEMTQNLNANKRKRDEKNDEGIQNEYKDDVCFSVNVIDTSEAEIRVALGQSEDIKKKEWKLLSKFVSTFETVRLILKNESESFPLSDYSPINSKCKSNLMKLCIENDSGGENIVQAEDVDKILTKIEAYSVSELTLTGFNFETLKSFLKVSAEKFKNVTILRFETINGCVNKNIVNKLAKMPSLESLSLACTKYDRNIFEKSNKEFKCLRQIGISNHLNVSIDEICERFGKIRIVRT